MNRFFAVLAALLLASAAALAELPLPNLGPQDLEPIQEPNLGTTPEAETETAGEVQGTPSGGYGWVENFADPAGNAPQVDEEELRQMVPALLSVERKVQYETACQYWIKLDNRLPFKIRNMAIRFSAYIMKEGYDWPILFDTAIRSYSEMRPTDTQYRDIFFEYVSCKELEFIKVEDAGRCSVGELTKFSAQSGDCARFIEIKESEDICIYLDTGLPESGTGTDGAGRARPPLNPCGVIMQADVDILLEQFEANYETGDLENFAALFDMDVTVNGGVGRDLVEQEYGNLFRTSTQRSLELSNPSWKPGRNGSATIHFDVVAVVDKGSYWGPEEYEGSATMNILKRKDGVFVSSFLHDQSQKGKLPDFH